MEIESINPIIRKITIGDLKQGLTYKVGQKMLGGSVEVTAIIQDEAAWYKHQQVVYDVYTRSEGEEFSRPWKRFFDQPTAIEFDVQERDSYEVK
jgi:hypothetical protein|tara:strand:+ start:1648 stop:1929 length:282 start_codon:yes stop_codon:yes gene_type:complete